MPEAETVESETPYADRFEAIENKVKNATKEGLPRAYAERGSLRSALGSDREGLKDLLRAHALHHGNARVSRNQDELQQAGLVELLEAYLVWEEQDAPGLHPIPDWCPDPELGEALRVFARDSLLSLTPGNTAHSKLLVGVVVAAVRCFERSLANLEKFNSKALTSGAQRKARGWIYAHRAACLTLLYWMRRSAGVDIDDAVAKELYDRAESGFSMALEELPEYVWALKFKAFLLALRGGPRGAGQMSDFRRARNMLKRVGALDKLPGGGLKQSSLQRSMAMLFSYDVGDVHEKGLKELLPDGRDAAVKCIEAAMTAIMEDPEDFLAAYFGVLGTWYMAAEQGSEFHAAALPSALRSAQVRARNAFSQALAALAGLEELQDRLEGKSTSDVFRNLLKKPDFGLDWETRAIFMRDPLTKLLAKDVRKPVRDLFAIPRELTDQVVAALGTNAAPKGRSVGNGPTPSKGQKKSTNDAKPAQAKNGTSKTAGKGTKHGKSQDAHRSRK